MAKRYEKYTDKELAQELVIAIDAALEADEKYVETGKAYFIMQHRSKWVRYHALKRHAEERWHIRFPYLKTAKDMQRFLESRRIL